MMLIIVSGLILCYLGWSLLALEINYRRAATMGIPLVRLPIDPLNILFQVLESHVWNFVDGLPFKVPLPSWTRYARRGWYFKDKADSHLRYGPIWALVTPRDIHISVCDAEVVHDVFARRNDFVRPNKMYKLLDVYGPAISSADQANWPRHRKVLATPFNENAMSFVWDETLRQTKGLVECWTRNDNATKIRVANDTRALSLNVMAACGFRRSFSFQDSLQEEPEIGPYSYRKALQIVLDNSILLMLLPHQYLQFSWLPRSLRNLGKAASDFKLHMIRMLDEETRMMNRGERGSGSLMTSFVRALHNEKTEDETVPTISKGLSMEEIFGNIFVVNFAGHDTTANTLAFSMLLLAAYPYVQQWVREEIHRVTKGIAVTDWDYNTLFPQLKRCRAVLLETLRLHPPILSLPKWTNANVQSLRVGSRTIHIPPYSGISAGVLATHTHPNYWTEPLVWKPSRWIESGHNTSDGSTESLLAPTQGIYYPWSDGPQICLGVKFSQVEFVAVMAGLLRGHRLSVVRIGAESNEDVIDRVLRVTEDCDFQMLLRMKHPEIIRLRFETLA